MISTLESISSGIDAFRDSYEILVSDNNSNVEDQKILREYVNPNLKVKFNDKNAGFGINLRKSIDMASGDFILLLGDDDVPEIGQVPELIQFLKRKKDNNLFFLPLMNLPNIQMLPRALVPWVSMRSGCMMGIVFPNMRYKISEVNFSGTIYPQIELALRIYFACGFHNYVSNKKINVGAGAPLIDRFSDKMSRPTDYGVVERICIIRRLHLEKLISFKGYCDCFESVLTWALGVFFKLLGLNRSLAFKYAKSVWFHSPEKPFFFFILIRIFLRSTALKFYKILRSVL